jgi:flagellar basal body-associated protein FliL
MQTQEQLSAKKKNPIGKIIAIIAILLVVAGVASCACNFNNQDQVTEMANRHKSSKHRGL